MRLLADAAAQPDPAAAVALLAEAVALSKEEHSTGVVLDAPLQLWDFVDAAPNPPSGVRRLAATARNAASELVSSFSARELEVIAMLDGPALAREMAEELFVSTNTVRWYLARIYRKLDVGDRASAVIRAKELGLL